MIDPLVLLEFLHTTGRARRRLRGQPSAREREKHLVDLKAREERLERERNSWEDTAVQWEYRTVSLNTTGLMGGKLDAEEFDRMLNDLGRDRWELVDTFDTSLGAGTTRAVFAIFKRSAS